jgi:enamine deaminase RidA (YjgF/YER057c/UK114 family)
MGMGRERSERVPMTQQARDGREDAPCANPAPARPCTRIPLPHPTGRTRMSTIERRHVGKRLSELVIHRGAGLCWLAGQVANDPKADVTGQTRQVLAQIDALLAEAGTDKSRIVSATIYLPDMADFAAMNAVWEPWVAPGQPPARATVQAALAAPAYRVEIQVVAAL